MYHLLCKRGSSIGKLLDDQEKSTDTYGVSEEYRI